MMTPPYTCWGDLTLSPHTCWWEMVMSFSFSVRVDYVFSNLLIKIDDISLHVPVRVDDLLVGVDDVSSHPLVWVDDVSSLSLVRVDISSQLLVWIGWRLLITAEESWWRVLALSGDSYDITLHWFITILAIHFLKVSKLGFGPHFFTVHSVKTKLGNFTSVADVSMYK
jgi:hypothetical protein